MPFKDPVKRKENHSKWMREAVADGYGKWLYAKRKIIRSDADAFRQALNEILHDASSIEAARVIASRVLKASEKEHTKLGTWRQKRVHADVSGRESDS